MLTSDGTMNMNSAVYTINMNIGHFILHATPKASARALLGAICELKYNSNPYIICFAHDKSQQDYKYPIANLYCINE